MSDDECVHGMTAGCDYCAERRARAWRNGDVVEVSPHGVGHIPGCTHKDDPDRSKWGEVHATGAWRELANGNPITTNAGDVRGLVATRACQTCLNDSR